MNAIEVRNLQKSFGDLKAVQEVDFSVQQGEIFSLLGPMVRANPLLSRSCAACFCPPLARLSSQGIPFALTRRQPKPAWAWSRRILHCTPTFRHVRTWYSGAKCMDCAAHNSGSGWMKC